MITPIDILSDYGYDLKMPDGKRSISLKESFIIKKNGTEPNRPLSYSYFALYFELHGAHASYELLESCFNIIKEKFEAFYDSQSII